MQRYQVGMLLGTRPLRPGRRCPPILIHPASQQGGGGEVDKHGRWSEGGVGGARNQFNFLNKRRAAWPVAVFQEWWQTRRPRRVGQWVVKGARSPVHNRPPGGSSTSEPAGGGGDHHQCLLHHQGGRGWRCLCFKASLTQA